MIIFPSETQRLRERGHQESVREHFLQAGADRRRAAGWSLCGRKIPELAQDLNGDLPCRSGSAEPGAGIRAAAPTGRGTLSKAGSLCQPDRNGQGYSDERGGTAHLAGR